jgi:hypothetical protein
MILHTGSGFWSALVWIASFLGIFLIAYLFYRTGEGSYKKGTDQADPFLSGNEPRGERVTAHHIYWGFVEALKKYYNPLVRMHTGVVNDYLGWFVIVIALVFLFVGGIVR